MADKPKSFEEFYFSIKDDTLDINIVADYADSHKGNIGEFDGNMFCPECKKAELSFVHRTSKRRAHLRRNRSSKHKDGCSYNYDYASKRTVKKYVDSLSYDEIQDKLSSIMNMLCNKHKKKSGGSEANVDLPVKVQNPMLIHETTNNVDILRALRRKRLNAWIDKSDGDDFYVFYAKVKLKIVEKEKTGKKQEDSYKYYLLQIFTHNKKGEWKFRTSLYRGIIKDVIDENTIYTIVMIGHLDFKFKPFTIKLANKNAIKYQQIWNIRQ